MKPLFYIFLLFFYLNSFSQYKISEKEFEKERLEIEKLSKINIDSSKARALRLLESAKKDLSPSKIAKAQSTLAYVLVFEVKTDEASVLNSKSLKYNTTSRDSSEIAKNYFIDAIIAARKSDFVKSVALFFKSIDIAKKYNNMLLIQKSYRGLANSYCDQRNYGSALKYALEALKYSNPNGDLSEASYINATIAEIYRLKGDCKKANILFEKAYSSFIKIKEKHGQAYVLTNWSLCYDYEKSLEMELKAQEIWDKTAPENLMSVTNLGNIANSYFMFGYYDSIAKTIKNKDLIKTKKQYLILSEQYYSRCLSIAKKKDNLDAVLFYSSSLSELYYYKGDYKNAFLSLELRTKIHDSLYSQKNKNKIARLESQKEIELRDKEIQLNKLTLQAKEREKWLYIGGILLLTTIGVLLYYQSRNRRKTNEKLQRLNTDLDQANKTKTRFFSILNHDLRAPVSNLVHFLHLQKENPELLNEENKKRLENKTITGAENLLTSMEDLLLWSKGQMENFMPQPRKLSIAKLFEDTKKHFSSEDKVSIAFENSYNIELISDENYLKTIIRNLTGNAIKALEKTADPTILWKA
ncbi:MAG: sensor histidine kinase, partial [Flavobacterium sp.]